MLAIIYYSFYNDRLKYRNRYFIDYVEKLKPNTVVLVKTIDNDCLVDDLRMLGGINLVILDHDNLNWEFGAYKLALDYLRNRGAIENILLMNDTVSMRQYIGRKSKQLLIDIISKSNTSSDEQPLVAGELDSLPTGAFKINNLSACGWIRSSLIFLNRSALDCLNFDFMAWEFDYSLSISSNEIIFTPHISSGLSEHINFWLFKKGGWHSQRLIEDCGREFAKKKIASILKEKYLSALFYNANFTIKSINPRAPYSWTYKIMRKINLTLKKAVI